MEFRRSYVPHRPKRKNIPKRVDYRREVKKSQELEDSEESEEWIEWLEIVEDFYKGRVTKDPSDNYINIENIEENGDISTEITTKSKCVDVSTQTEFDNRMDVLENEAIEVVTALNNMEDIEKENAVCSAISTIENQTTEETIVEIPGHTWETDIMLENDVTIPARTEAMVYAKLKVNLKGNSIVCEPIELGNGYVHTASCSLENSSKIWKIDDESDSDEETATVARFHPLMVPQWVNLDPEMNKQNEMISEDDESNDGQTESESEEEGLLKEPMPMLRRHEVAAYVLSVCHILEITFLLLFRFMTQVKGTIAYDCEDKNIETTVVSIREVAKCPELESAYKSESSRVKILQRDEINLQQDIESITMNGTTTATLTIGGSVDLDGSCQGSTYHENGQTWKNVVIIATIKIQVTDYLARVKMDENELVLSGGVICPFLKGYCFDTTLGEITWDVNPLRTLNNLTKFMGPVTRIIQSYADEVDCTALTPPLYLIDDQWIGLSPYPTVKKAPEELSPESHLTLSFAPIQPITLGIYTQEEITNAQRILTFGNKRKAVENIIARRVAGLETTGQGFSTLNISNPEEMKELAHNTMQQI
ncbi:unnamed protein product [Phaedon cochleariae]|uniref:Uncharacterized protein n=1 Tax=Phaedon cochleariae TaxID=80249 RepID=A0A9N9SE92_PHACE|nr:unnamed protein product [Phaedon cochleariae]